MNPSRIFILRPVATSLLMAAILLAGFVAYTQLPVSALPEVQYPTIRVITFYPGASPDVMTALVTAPLERQFGEVPGLKEMTSTGSSGASEITLEFDLDQDINVAEQEVQAAINSAGTYLPPDLPNPPVYSKVNPADAPILTLGLSSSSLPLPQVEDLADSTLAQKISQVLGVGLVSIDGGQRPAVRIQANPTVLASYGLSLEDVRTALAASNVDQAKGTLQGPRLSYTINDNDQLMSAPDYRPIVIAYRNGSPVRVSDVAQAVSGTENTEEAAWMDQSPAVIVNVQRQPGANIISVVNRIKTLLPRLEAALPASVQVRVLTDRTTTIRASVRDVEWELSMTVGLVILVIFLFLRTVSGTIIPSIAVPLSLVGTFGVMYLIGFSLDNLSLMALTISTGFVVDDAIVMIENISRFIEQGDSPLEAALKGSKQIGFTILSLTVSLIAVLIPLLFMGDVVGRLFREFAITLAVTIIISAIVSLTLTPMMSARLLRHRPEEEQGKFYLWSERVFEYSIEKYGASLRWVMGHQPAVLLITLGTLVLTIYLYVIVPKGFFPVEDTGVIQGTSEASETISFPAMAEEQQQLVDVILKDPAVANVSSFIGIDGTNMTMNSGRIQITLKPVEERNATASEIIRRLQPQLAKVHGITLFMQPVQDLTIDDRISRTEFQYSLADANANELNTWAPRLAAKLQALPQLRDVATDQQDHGLETSLVVDRDTASRLGVTPAAIDNTLYDAFGQRQISTIFTQLNQYHVVLEVAPNFQQSPDALKNLFVNTSTGTQVPLGSFARFEPSNSSLEINHQGQFPSVTLSFNLAPGASLSQAVDAINKASAEIGMPASINASFQGTAAAFQASLANEPLLILAALVTVYIVLGILYESYIHPLTILSTLPSAGVGAILALLLFHIEFSVIALIGVILLIGIVKKNAIMMIDFALEGEREQGKTPLDAIYEACLLRFRPIMMTTMAALLGGLPLALATGTGAELRRPLGITIVGGLVLSQVLTLYTTPVVYLYFDRLARYLRGSAFSSDVASSQPAEDPA
ncbi:MAG TPA: multidrug efflux RND transporter permease subunit [Terriglobia bacterium]|nr:multidrug efflux RND transporter permease subunit [Terriglobia bacterium]